ncbi:MAG TPA: type II secretion system protein GspC [Nevskiaceae bacterium]
MATRTAPAWPQTTSIRRFLTRHARRLPAAVSALLVLVVAWLAGGFLWTLIPTPDAARWRAPPVVPRASPAAEAASIAEDRNVVGLFGTARGDGSSASALATAPETQLNLKLFGILADRDAPSRSRALVATGNGETKPYALGQSLASGVLLKAIFPDRIVLQRNDRLETLRLDLKRRRQDTVSDRPIAVAGPPPPEAKPSALRKDLLSDPSAPSRFIRVQPVQAPGADGQTGYRVYPGTDPGAFDAAGLHGGDLVTAINGTALSDPARALQAVSQLSQAQRVKLTVQRDGRTRTVDLDFTP